MESTYTPERTTFRTRLTKLWQWLTYTHPSLETIGSRRRAQLLATVSFLLAVMTAIGTFSSLAVNQGDRINANVYLLAGLTVATLLAYIMSRTRYYEIGSILVTGALSVSAFTNVMMGSENISKTLLTTLPIAYAVGSGLLSVRGMAGLTGFNIAGILLLSRFVPTYPTADIGGDVGSILTIGVLLLGVIAFRNAIERERVAEVEEVNRELQDLSAGLEQRVVERTQDLALAAEIGQRVTLLQDPGRLLADAAELIRDRFNLYYTQIYLTDPSRRLLVLRAGTGEAGQTLLRRGHRLPIDLGSINGTVAVERRAVIVADTETSTIHRPNPLLPDTRSEMAVPLIAGERVVGVLDMQSAQPGALSEENLAAFEVLAGQLATTIINTELFIQTEQARTEVEAQAQRLTQTGWGEFLDALERSERIGFTYDLETLSPLPEPLTNPQDGATLSAPIQVSGTPVGAFQFEGKDAWTEEEKELVQAVAQQVAQQVDNLRLLAQTEQYRVEAESAVRRLTREGWQDFQMQVAPADMSFVYKDNRVTSLTEGDDGHNGKLTYEIKVRDEPIGQFGITGVDSLSREDSELVDTINQQLSAHIENLRLQQQTEQALARTDELYGISQSINEASSEEEILQALARPAMEADASSANLVYLEMDEDGTPIWAEVAAIWPEGAVEEDSSFGVGTRLYLPDMPFSQLWVSNPNEPILVSDFTRDERLDDMTRQMMMMGGNQALVIIPLTRGEQRVGLVIFNWEQQHQYSQHEVEAYNALIGLASPAVQSRRLFAQTQIALSQTEMLYKIGSQLNTASNEEELIQAMAGPAMEAGANSANLVYLDVDESGAPTWAEIVAIWQEEEIEEDSPIGVGMRIYLPDMPFSQLWVANPDEPVFVSDVENDERLDDMSKQMMVMGDSKALVIIPLTRAEERVGLIIFNWTEPHEFSQQEQEIYRALIGLGSPAAQSRRLFEQIQGRAAELATVSEVSTLITNILDPQEMLQTTVDLTKERFDLYHAHVYLLEDSTLELTAGAGEVGRQMVEEGWQIPLSRQQSLVAQAARSRSGVIINNVSNEPGYMANELLPDTKAEMAIPLVIGETVLGVLDVQADQVDRFDQEDVSIMNTLTAQVAVSLQNARTYELTQRRAEREATINLISQRIQSTTSVENALQVAIRELGRVLGARQTSVQLDVSGNDKGAN